MQMAREKLNEEINIIEIVKSWRNFKRALRMLLSEEQRTKCKERSRYIAIDPDFCEDLKSFRTSKTQSQKKAKQFELNFSDGFFSSHESESQKEQGENSQ